MHAAGVNVGGQIASVIAGGLIFEPDCALKERRRCMEQLLQSLNVMLLGMCGIFIVMSVLSLAIALLNRMFKK